MKLETSESVVDTSSDDAGEELATVASDDALLISLGKTPELKRVYNFWTLYVSLHIKRTRWRYLMLTAI
jgi:hypothetical protein